jgi:hypothetical protein
VKGHYTGPSPEIQHDLNIEADKLVTDYQHHQPQSFTTRRLPIAPPNYKVHLLHDTLAVTSKAYTLLTKVLHDNTLKAYIL